MPWGNPDRLKAHQVRHGFGSLLREIKSLQAVPASRTIFFMLQSQTPVIFGVYGNVVMQDPVYDNANMT